MFPLSIINEYGNTAVASNWYKGTELVAWDSAIYNSNGFTDYTGKAISVGLGVASQSGTVLPSKSTQGFMYGDMLFLGHGAYIGTRNDVITNEVMSNDWCIDFWLKNDGIGFGVYPLISLPNVTTNTGSARLFITSTASNSGIVLIAANSAQVNASAKWSQLFDGNVHHYGIQYIASTSQWRFYVDGVLQQALTLNIPLTTSRKDICLCSTATTYNAYVERYRLRSGQYFTGSTFDTSNIYN